MLCKYLIEIVYVPNGLQKMEVKAFVIGLIYQHMERTNALAFLCCSKRVTKMKSSLSFLR